MELAQLSYMLPRLTGAWRSYSQQVGGIGTAEGAVRVEFLHCPFRELAEAYPDLVCSLHRGICAGVIATAGGGRMQEFATLYDPEPCHVTVATG